MNDTINLPLEDFGYPASIAFSKDGRAFFGERMTGRLYEIKADQISADGAYNMNNYRLIITFPIIPLIGHHETGLLGIALDPDFGINGYIYCYYTYGTNEKDFRNRVIRIHESGAGEDDVIDDIPAGFIHNGGVIAFGKDKKLYIGTGENGDKSEKAQDLDSYLGKILRMNTDGSIPKDNPFPDSPIFAYGFRNISGLAVHPKTGFLYAHDVGPDRDDEINIVEAGANYGWPIVKGISKDPRFRDPIKTYTPVITPTQSVFVKDQLYFGSYDEGTVHRLTLKGKGYDRVIKDEIVYKTNPFGVLGVFHNDWDDKFYLTTPASITHFDPEVLDTID